ncbi:MAG: hypothetical protein WDN01_08415 [Rhizomicrobium sp.]
MDFLKSLYSRAKVIGEYLPLFLLWLVVVPYFFMLLYSVLELQSAARAATGSNTKLATYIVITRAKQIAPMGTTLEGFAKTARAAQNSYDLLFAKWTALQEKFVDDETFLAAAIPDTTFNSKTCQTGDGSYDRDAVLNCGRRLLSLAAPITQKGVALDASKEETAHGALVNNLLAPLLKDMSLFEQYAGELYVAGAAARSAKQDYAAAASAYRALVGVTGTTVVIAVNPTILDDRSDVSAAPTAPGSQSAAQAPATAAKASEAPTPTDSIGSVATSYNNMQSMWFFEFLFRLPPGVVVAFFTALMGSIGACVFSLLQQAINKTISIDVVGAWISYGVRPVLGAMAGFMVFFVVSAGAAFLVQPGAASATDAVNSLSAPALASLGVFAGVAAERALQWLNEKASAFFETTEKQDDDLPKLVKPAGA